MSELALRVVFSVIAAPLALWLVLAGGLPLALLLAVASALAAWEFYRIARAAGAKPLDDVGIALAGAGPLAVYAHVAGMISLQPAVIAVLVIVIMGATIWLRGVQGQPLGAAATTIFGVVYTAGMLSFGYAIRNHNIVSGYDAVSPEMALGAMRFHVAPGGVLLILPLVVTWASDIGAFFVGRTAGGRKLIPSVSPGKTVSGAVGGLGGSIIVAYFYARGVLVPLAHIGFTPWGAFAFGLIVSVAAQTGDLFESLLKRESGVKDSSRIIPGHGGVLDRLDSLFFVLPVAYVLLSWLPIPVFH